jgi:DNA-binding response OmpR family regulator
MSENKQKSVLIIETDDAILDSLSNRFKQRDMLVITAKDGYEGYTRACNESPDYIVSETLLPSMNGFRVSRLLKFDDRFKETHVILITSNNVDSVQDMFRASGADHILGKPFRFRDLMESIEGVKAA